MIKIEITETGRGSLRDEAHIFNREYKFFKNVDEVKEYLIERYGKMPNGKNKIYIDKKDGSKVVCGFLYSYWNYDWSHNSKKWYQTDWISFNEVNYTDFNVKQLFN